MAAAVSCSFIISVGINPREVVSKNETVSTLLVQHYWSNTTGPTLLSQELQVAITAPVVQQRREPANITSANHAVIECELVAQARGLSSIVMG